MTRLAVLLLLLALAACGGDDAPGPAGPDQELSAQGSPLRSLTEAEAEPGPKGQDPPCTAFAPAATCTRVGDVVWVLQADGGSWQLTSYAVDEDRERWVPRLQGSGGGLSPTVSEVDLTDDEQPETLVVYGGGFDVVGREAGDLRVVAHGEGQAAVQDGAVVAGEREVRLEQGRWVSVARP